MMPEITSRAALIKELNAFLCDPARPLQESPRPSGPGTPKSLRESLPGPSGPGVEKVSKTVSKQSPETLSETFWGSGPGGPGRLLQGAGGVASFPL